MKKLLGCFFYALIFVLSVFAKENEFRVTVSSDSSEKMKLLICMNSYEKELIPVANVLKSDFEFSQQFDVVVKSYGIIEKKSQLKKLCERGYPFVLFLSFSKDDGLTWMLHDTQQGEVIKRKLVRVFSFSRFDSHCVASSIWPELTGQKGVFTTKIAYCKDGNKIKIGNREMRARHVYTAEFDGKNSRCLVGIPTYCIAPRWNKDPANPTVLYSEHTKSNLRLMGVDLYGKRWVASNLKGLNMLPSFSATGGKTVLCLSGSGNGNLYLLDESKKGSRILTRLTSKGRNFSPCMLDDGSGLFFCSDFQSQRPQIYFMRLPDKKIKKITTGGYCVSPNYSSVAKKLVYAKMVSGVLQLFLYDAKTKEHKQVTFNYGNKDDCSWSPCGNYLIYSVRNKGRSRIAIMHIITRNVRFVTGANEYCTYPSWSPVYTKFVSA